MAAPQPHFISFLFLLSFAQLGDHGTFTCFDLKDQGDVYVQGQGVFTGQASCVSKECSYFANRACEFTDVPNTMKQDLEDLKSDIGWGHQIRSYVLDQSRIKDLRTGVESSNTQDVLDGNLDQFIVASLKAGL